MTCFDILNIEYNEEGYLLDFNLPDTMRICVKEGDNWSHTEEAIRKQINNMEELYANDVKVVDFTAFYEGTDKPLRGNYEDYEAETFESKGYSPDKPYYATHHEEAPTTIMHPVHCGHYKMVMDGSGKWYLAGFYDTIEEMFTDIFDDHMETQYEGMVEWAMDDPDGKEVIREYKDIKTIGDARKFAKKYYGFKLDFAPCFRKQADYDAKALNALPITVHPFWIDDGGWAKEFSDTLREFQADAEYNVEFNEWADQEMMTHGKDISFKDWAEDEGMKHGNVPITEWAQHEEESHDARYGAESTNDLMDLKVGQEIKINGLMREGEIPSQTKLRHVREWDGEEYFPEYYEGYVDVPIADDGSISTDSHNALYYAVKYWMRPELGDKTDGYFFQFKARPMDEADGTWKGKPAYYPNKVRWGQLRWDKDQDRFFIDGLSDELSADGGYIHEDGDTLEARAYNERGIYSITPLEKKSAEEEEIWEDEDYYNIEGEDYWDRIEGMYEDFCEDWEDNPDNDGQDCPSMDEWVETYGNFDAEDLNWGGDPKGQLATALRKARIKAKEPKKPLKIEKLDAEMITRTSYACSDCGREHEQKRSADECCFAGCPHTWELDKTRDWEDGMFTMYVSCRKCGTTSWIEGHADENSDSNPTPTFNAETSGQWEIGEQLEEAQMNAETFEGIPKSVSILSPLEDVRCDKYEMEVNFENEDIVIVSGEELKAIMDDGWDLDSVRSFEGAGMSLLFTRNPNRAFRAEDKKRKKISGVLSDPFDELSLDSGGIKKWLAVGIIGGLTIFGYKKWK